MKQKPIKAVGYIRVSTEEQAASGLSLEAQKERIQSYVKLKSDLELVGIITDAGISAGVPLSGRPGGKNLEGKVRRGEIGAIIVMKLDRAFRSTIDCLQKVATWDQKGISFHVLDFGGDSLNTKSASGRFILTMSAAFSEMERGLAKERTAQALEHKRKRAEKTGGSIPYGYRLSKNRRCLVQDKNETKVLEKITRLRKRKNSLRTIAKKLNAQGIKTKNGRTWKAPQVQRALKNQGRWDCGKPKFL